MKRIIVVLSVLFILLLTEVTFAATSTEGEKEVENEPKYLVVIDAGHQMKGDHHLEPIGPGAKTKKKKVSYGTAGKYSKMSEYELTLILAKKLEKVLLDRGYDVIMVRTENDVNISNSQRAKIANKAKADAFIRIHANSSKNTRVYGAETICMSPKNPFNKELYSQSRKLSEAVIKELAKTAGCKNRGVKEMDNMSGINWSKVPVTIVEVGYMSNKKEDLKLKTKSYQNLLVEGMANGIDEFFK